MSFADLKRSSSSDFSFLQKELEKASTDSKGDERIWKPALNETGNGYAVIRFLPVLLTNLSHSLNFTLTHSKVQRTTGSLRIV